MLDTLAQDGAFFREIVDAAPDAMVIADSLGVIVLANSQTQTIFGYRADELVGQPVEVLVPTRYHEDHPRHRASFAMAASRRPMGLHQDLYAVHRDGREFPVEISLSPIGSGSDQLVVAAVRDITDRREIELEANRMREELIATVSHELRTPLTSIIGYAELLGDLDDEDLSPHARGLLAVIVRNAARELRLVDDLLTMAFLDDERHGLGMAPVDLVHVTRRVVEDHLLRAADAGVDLRFEGGDVPPVRGDVFRLIQVVENLITNAIKFTPRGGAVRVRVHDTDAGAALEVQDTGVGVTSTERARLFDRLYRGPRSGRRPGPGCRAGIVDRAEDPGASPRVCRGGERGRGGDTGHGLATACVGLSDLPVVRAAAPAPRRGG